MICANCHTESPPPEAMSGWLIKWNKAYCPDCKDKINMICTNCGRHQAIDETSQGWETTNDGEIHCPSCPIHDPVNHPKHYTSHPSGIECIQITRHMNNNRGNAIKYIWRCGDKGKPIQDLRKAIFYLEDEIKRLQEFEGVKE